MISKYAGPRHLIAIHLPDKALIFNVIASSKGRIAEDEH